MNLCKCGCNNLVLHEHDLFIHGHNWKGVKRPFLKREPLSEITRNKISNANSGINNGMYGAIVSEYTRLILSEKAKLMWLNPKIRSEITAKLNTPEAKIRNRALALKTAEVLKDKWFHNTAPEKQMIEILDKLSIKYIHTYPVWDIEHCYAADFYIEDGKIIIETDGKYWHNYPLGTDKDKIRVQEMEAKGYKVIRFWEGEFDLEIVKAKIEEVLEKILC